MLALKYPYDLLLVVLISPSFVQRYLTHMGEITVKYWHFTFVIFAFLFALSMQPRDASATLCGDTISTTWVAQDTVSESFSLTSFTACSTESVVEGDFQSSYTLTVQAIDDDTFGLSASSRGPTSFFLPAYELTLDGIEWFGMAGFIDSVTDNSDFWDLTSFDADTIQLSYVGTSFNCNEVNCSNLDMGTFDVVAVHASIPEPASFGLFITGLIGFGVMLRRRRKQTDAV